MKYFTTILLFYLYSVSLFSQVDSLKGEIKSIREKVIFLDEKKQNFKLFSSEGDYGHYDFTSPEFTFSRFNNWWFNTPWVHYLNYYQEYDKEHKLKSQIWFKKNDSSFIKYYYLYDKNANLIQQKILHSDSSYAIDNYSYNDSATLLTSMSYFSSDPTFYYYSINLQDEQKRIIEKINYNQDGESGGQKFEYNNKGQKLKILNHYPFIWVKIDDRTTGQKADKIGNDIVSEEYFYNKFDSVSKVNFYNEDFYDRNKAFLYKTELYEYDTKNRKKTASYITDTIIGTREYDYYDNNQLKRERLIAKNSSYNSLIEYFYNIDGMISKVNYVERDKTTVITFKYKFDIKNNWVEQQKIIDGKTLYIRRREIDYY